MLCQNCGNNEANVRYTQIVNGVKKEMNLCSECAEKMGINQDEIMAIGDNINDKDHIGVCLDTCHLNDSGIDINNFDEYLDEFDKIIGISKIGCIHINDSKNPINSHKDRHENIGFGTIGFDALINVIYNENILSIYTNKVELQKQLNKLIGAPTQEYKIKRSIVGSKWNISLTDKITISRLVLKANIFEL